MKTITLLLLSATWLVLLCAASATARSPRLDDLSSRLAQQAGDLAARRYRDYSRADRETLYRVKDKDRGAADYEFEMLW